MAAFKNEWHSSRECQRKNSEKSTSSISEERTRTTASFVAFPTLSQTFFYLPWKIMFFTTTESYFADCKNHKICCGWLILQFSNCVTDFSFNCEKIRHFEGFLLTVHQSTTIGALEMWIPTLPVQPWAKSVSGVKSQGISHYWLCAVKPPWESKCKTRISWASKVECINCFYSR